MCYFRGVLQHDYWSRTVSATCTPRPWAQPLRDENFFISYPCLNTSCRQMRFHLTPLALRCRCQALTLSPFQIFFWWAALARIVLSVLCSLLLDLILCV